MKVVSFTTWHQLPASFNATDIEVPPPCMSFPKMLKIQYKPKCVFSVQIESKKPLLANKPETFIETERS